MSPVLTSGKKKLGSRHHLIDENSMSMGSNNMDLSPLELKGKNADSRKTFNLDEFANGELRNIDEEK